MAMHLECVPEPAQRLAAKLFPAIGSLGFVLAGGTGLALQLGHRVSIDFDLFTSPEKYPTHLLDRIRGTSSALQVIQDKQDTLDILLDGVKCSFFSYPYPFLPSKPGFRHRQTRVLDIIGIVRFSKTQHITHSSN